VAALAIGVAFELRPTEPTKTTDWYQGSGGRWYQQQNSWRSATSRERTRQSAIAGDGITGDFMVPRAGVQKNTTVRPGDNRNLQSVPATGNGKAGQRGWRWYSLCSQEENTVVAHSVPVWARVQKTESKQKRLARRRSGSYSRLYPQDLSERLLVVGRSEKSQCRGVRSGSFPDRSCGT